MSAKSSELKKWIRLGGLFLSVLIFIAAIVAALVEGDAVYLICILPAAVLFASIMFGMILDKKMNESAAAQQAEDAPLESLRQRLLGGPEVTRLAQPPEVLVDLGQALRRTCVIPVPFEPFARHDMFLHGPQKNGRQGEFARIALTE